jgi:isopenicillin-N epimerase
MKIYRRNFLKSAASAALGVSVLPQIGHAQNSTKVATPVFPPPDTPGYWDKVRDEFMLSRDTVFFNNGTVGAMPRVVFERNVEHLRKLAVDVAEWDYSGDETNWIGGYGPQTEIRAKAARLLNTSVPELALTENVTAGVSFVASGLNLEPGSEILITNQEHEGGKSAWLVEAKRRNVVVTTVKMPAPVRDPEQVIEVFKKAITPRTKVIAISHVITGTGAILPAKEICTEARNRGIFTILDGAQAFGHVKVDVKELGCDAYAGCFHKWMLAPAGTGFLYLRKDRSPEVWSTVASGQWDNNADPGYRFTQRGTGSLSALLGLDSALDFHFAIGSERVQQRIKYLGDYLREGLRQYPKVTIHSPQDAAMCAGISVYGIAGFTGKQIQDEMWNRDRLRPRGSGPRGVRHCTHIYNSTAEIDRALKIVRDLTKA